MKAILLFAATGLLLADEPKSIQLPDILAWKRIQNAAISNDGQWFAYKVSPNEGNSEVVIRSLKDGKETRYPIGEQPRIEPNFAAPPPPPPRDLQISEDSKWVAFLEYPTMKEGKALKKQRKPAQSKLMLVELATGTKKEFDKIRRFAFAGERSSALAMHRYAPTPATPPAPPAPGAPQNDDRPQGSDLIVYGLKTESELN